MAEISGEVSPEERSARASYPSGATVLLATGDEVGIVLLVTGLVDAAPAEQPANMIAATHATETITHFLRSTSIYYGVFQKPVKILLSVSPSKTCRLGKRIHQPQPVFALTLLQRNAQVISFYCYISFKLVIIRCNRLR